jgi:hypothetical protein
MRQSTIARNYAEALLELAKRAKDLRGWGALIQSIADAMQRDQTLRAFLETPRVGTATKNEVLRKALADRAPSKFVRFVESVVSHRRQMLIPEIAQEYMDLVDVAENRLHGGRPHPGRPGRPGRRHRDGWIGAPKARCPEAQDVEPLGLAQLGAWPQPLAATSAALPTMRNSREDS